MKKIYIKVATNNNRGFLKNLFDSKLDNIIFNYNKNSLYDVNTRKHIILSKLIKNPLFDLMGIFQVINVKDVKEDVCLSYNRFLKVKKPYYIILENPSALVNYCWDRPKHLIGKIRLRKKFNDEYLKGVICISKACKKKLRNLYNLPTNLKIYQIYPMIYDDKNYEKKDVIKKANQKELKCLYISSDFELKGGRDILKTFEMLQDKNLDVKLDIITRKDTIRQEDIKKIRDMNNINLIEFGISKNELNEYYKKASILLNPTRMDSFSLVTLEAIKYGCAIIATDIYAINEMVINGFNGYLEKPLYKIWDDDGTLNKYIRTHMKKTILSGKTDEKLINNMYNELLILEKNRAKLEEMCINSFLLSRNDEFSENTIKNKWESLIEEVVN